MAPQALLLAMLSVVLAGPVAPVSAAPEPFAGELRTAAATFQLGGRDGRTWVVRL